MTGGGSGKADIAGSAGGAAGDGGAAAGGMAGTGAGTGGGELGATCCCGVAGAGAGLGDAGSICTDTAISRTGCDDTRAGSHSITNIKTWIKTTPNRETSTPLRRGREDTPRCGGSTSSTVDSTVSGTGNRGVTYFSRNPATLRHYILTLYASHMPMCL
jgi:hypothetical protein